VSGPATAVAVATGLASAAAFGLASALQHHQAGRVTRTGALDPALLSSLVRRPLWLLGVLADGLAVALQAVGLRFGPVALVQPLLIAGLPVAVVLSALLEHRRPSGREVAGILLCTAGLAVLAPATATAGLGGDPGRRSAILAGLVLAAVVGALLLAARLRNHWSPVATGTAAGVTVGAGSVLLAVCALRVDHPGRLLTSIAPYALIAVGLLGLALTQAAFQTGALGAPLAALSVMEPVVAVALAVAVLHEHLPAAATGRVLAAIGATAAVAGVVVLSRRAPARARAG
jgi:drug/metabolite transporter (DMT)-like permease